MIIIIDAYNMLRSVEPHGREVSESERNKFLALVGKYGKIKHHKMVVVFDGGPVEWVFKEKQHGVYIIFSGYNQSADDVIKTYVDEHKNQDILLASSDREIRAYAARFGIPSIGSYHFYQIMIAGLQEDHKIIHKTEPLEVEDIEDELTFDELMEQASEVVPVKAEDMPKDIGISRKGKRSKADKKLEKVLKKL